MRPTRFYMQGPHHPRCTRLGDRRCNCTCAAQALRDDIFGLHLGEETKASREATPHRIPIGALVEHVDGFRLFVVAQKRDCDGTPLYWLSYDADDIAQKNPHFANDKWVGGFAENGLRVVPRISR